MNTKSNHKLLQFIRWALIAVLVLVLIIIGHIESSLKRDFAVFLNSWTSSPNLFPYNQYLTSNVSRLVNLAYRIVYIILLFSITHLYFMDFNISKFAMLFYTSLFIFTFILYVIAYEAQSAPLHVVAFRIDSFLVSPMPVILLIPAFYLTKHH
ncbi:XrtX-associated membrane protein [Pontibacter saemangeumensis]|uniref:XrtX-associated membrane protein n=1 Tax=Pontibacter saemangeumensis TaxID=1084525 RepID=UPI003CD08692